MFLRVKHHMKHFFINNQLMTIHECLVVYALLLRIPIDQSSLMLGPPAVFFSDIHMARKVIECMISTHGIFLPHMMFHFRKPFFLFLLRYKLFSLPQAQESISDDTIAMPSTPSNTTIPEHSSPDFFKSSSSLNASGSPPPSSMGSPPSIAPVSPLWLKHATHAPSYLSQYHVDINLPSRSLPLSNSALTKSKSTPYPFSDVLTYERLSTTYHALLLLFQLQWSLVPSLRQFMIPCGALPLSKSWLPLKPMAHGLFTLFLMARNLLAVNRSTR